MTLSDVKPLAIYLYRIAGLIRRRDFLGKVLSLKSRFDGEASQIAHTKLVESLFDSLKSAIPLELATEIQGKKLKDMSKEDWKLLVDIIAGRFQSIADNLGALEISSLELIFSVPRKTTLNSQALACLSYKDHWSNVQLLTYLKTPEGRLLCQPTVTYVSDALFAIRAFMVATSVMEQPTEFPRFENVLQWAFRQPTTYWVISYPHDLLVHDYDAVRRAESAPRFIRLQRRYLSTVYGDASATPNDDIIEFRV